MLTDEEKLTRLYHQIKKSEPSANLDNAILRAARDAIQDDLILNRQQAKKTATTKRPLFASPFAGGWRVPASIAAILVITVILLPLLQQEERQADIPIFSDDEPMLKKQQDFIIKSKTGKENRQAITSTIEREQIDALQMQQLTQSSADTANMNTSERAKQFAGEEKTQAVKTMVAQPEAMLSPAQKNQSAPVAVDAASLYVETPAISTNLKPQQRLMSVAGDSQVSIMSAKSWLQKIRQLISQGDLHLAQEELDEFKLHYPDEVIEPSIINRLRDVSAK